MPWSIIVPAVLGYLASRKASKAQAQYTGYQYQVSEAQILSDERIFEKNLELDREKFEFLKKQAASPIGQTGSYGFPYVAVKQYKAAPLITMPVLLVGGGLLFYFVRRKR
ncbi:hypothetical protein ES703_10217 [subsurface metagenome]